MKLKTLINNESLLPDTLHFSLDARRFLSSSKLLWYGGKICCDCLILPGGVLYIFNCRILSVLLLFFPKPKKKEMTKTCGFYLHMFSLILHVTVTVKLFLSKCTLTHNVHVPRMCCVLMLC